MRAMDDFTEEERQAVTDALVQFCKLALLGEAPISGGPKPEPD
jgi:hypothetical protein